MRGEIDALLNRQVKIKDRQVAILGCGDNASGGSSKIRPASVNHAVARATRAPATSRRTTGHLLPQSCGRRGVKESGRWRPVPPVHHRARSEVAPHVSGALHQDQTVAGDFEAQEGRGVFQADEVHDTARRACQRHLERSALVHAQPEHANVEVAVCSSPVARGRSEQDGETYRRLGFERLDE